MSIRLPNGYVSWERFDGEAIMIRTYADYIAARDWRRYDIWRVRISAEDAIIRKNNEAKEDVIKVLRAADRKKPYIPKEQEYIGVEGMNYIFEVL